MPGFDGTGPQGAGAMTGGARGYCNPAGANVGANIPRGGGYGRGYGRGFGRGYGACGYPPPAAPYSAQTGAQPSVAQAEANSLKEALNAINERLSALEKKISE
jgi:hypothetical protein